MSIWGLNPRLQRNTQLVSVHIEMPRKVDKNFIRQSLDPRGEGSNPPKHQDHQDLQDFHISGQLYSMILMNFVEAMTTIIKLKYLKQKVLPS